MLTTKSITMEKMSMVWSKEIERKWKAFENAVLSRDKNQFKLYCEYAQEVRKNKSQKIVQEEEELEFN